MPGKTENPLLAPQGLPPFARIRAEHVVPAITTVLDDSRAGVAALLAGGKPYTWETLAAPMEELEDRLNRVWSPVAHLHAVLDSPALRAAYNDCLPKISEYATELGQNAALFRAYQSIAQSTGYAHLDRAARKLIDDALRDFRLGGVDLPPAEKDRYRTISRRLSELCNRFEENVLDATQSWHKHIADPAQLQGLPERALALSREAARQKGLDGWLVTLEYPSYLPVISYADDRELRREVYQAYATRASDQGPEAGRWDNSETMTEILALRHELAQLLGFHDYAEFSLAKKMARSPDEVMRFLHDLAQRSRAAAAGEYEELKAFARDEFGHADLQAWDVAYYSEKLRERRYAISQEDLRPYFPLPRVLAGLFEVVRRLYGVQIHRVDGAEVWHPDVHFYEVRDAQGTLRGQFYLDPYARAHKRGGAWMDECIVRKRSAAGVQIPVAHLVCNFPPASEGRPSLLAHDDVITLFHEFGHGLHHLLTQVDYPSVAGINGVPWDAVELPSQLLEHWCWESEALAHVSGHFATGEPLPQELFRRLHAAKTFQAGMQMVRQLEFALFDFRLHLEYDPARGARVQEVLDDVRREVAVVQPPLWNRFAHSFSHIFGGGYAAGYYSYKWAEVLACDAFARFEENGIFDRETGLDFLHTILEQGGSRSAMELFVEFRGREPDIGALLRHSGLIHEAAGAPA